MAQEAVCSNTEPSQYHAVGFGGHIPGLREHWLGNTYGCATTQLLQPGGVASTPAWTGQSAVRPQWSSPGSKAEERPAWLGAAFDYYNAASRVNSCNKSAVEIGAAGQTQDLSQGRASRRDIFGKQYEFPCRPEWKQFERPRHVADKIDTCLSRPLSNDQRTVIIQPPPCDYSAGKRQVYSLPRSKSTLCNYDPPMPSTSPYELPNNHPDKVIPCGYTGVTPYGKEAAVGERYADTMRKALNRVSCDKMRHQNCDENRTCIGQRLLIVGLDGKPRYMTDADCCPRPTEQQVVYPTHSGMIPNYTGHLPGYRWRIGHTFGLTTRNLKQELVSRRAPCR